MTIQLFRKVLWSKLAGIDDATSRELSDAMAVKSPGAQFTPQFKAHVWDGRIRFFRRPSNTFPSGLEKAVTRWLDDHCLDYEIIEQRNVPQQPPACFDLGGGIKLRDFQLNAVRSALQQHTGILWIATNGGKTEIAASVIKSIHEPTVFLTHRKELFIQTVERLAERLDLCIEDIGIFCTQDVAKQLKRTSSIDIKYVTVAMIQSLLSKSKREQATKFLLTRQVLIADECHIMPAQTWRSILTACPAYYRFGLSGTALRGEKEQIRNWTLIGFIGPVIARVRNNELIAEGFSSPVKVTLVEFDTMTIYGDYDTARTEGIVFNDSRNGAIIEVVRVNPGKSILIVVNFIDHGDTLKDMLTEVNPTTEFTSGQETTDRRMELWGKFKRREITCLITSPILDVGVDTDVIDVLVLAAGGKSNVQLLQRIGRGLRIRDEKRLDIFDFVDAHNEYLLEHSLERLAVYKDEQFDRQFVSVTELDDLIRVEEMKNETV